MFEKIDEFMYNSSMTTEVRRCRRCGAEFVARTSASRAARGKYCSKSCSVTIESRRHGHVEGGQSSRTYNSWTNMKARCGNPNAPNYVRYGGRGIRVCSDWAGSFQNFLRDMGARPEGCTLDRIDPNGDYEPGNCRWLPKAKQQQNLRTNRMIAFAGEVECLNAWARRTGISACVIAYRLDAGWPVEDALTITPALGNRRLRQKTKLAPPNASETARA